MPAIPLNQRDPVVLEVVEVLRRETLLVVHEEGQNLDRLDASDRVQRVGAGSYSVSGADVQYLSDLVGKGAVRCAAILLRMGRLRIAQIEDEAGHPHEPDRSARVPAPHTHLRSPARVAHPIARA